VLPVGAEFSPLNFEVAVPDVNPEVVGWARRTSGLSLEDAAKALDIATPERLAAIENGERSPSRTQLVKMSKAYRRPLLTFYLAAPPARGDRGEDFRSLPADRAERDDAFVDVLVRDLKARQGLIHSTLVDEEEQQPLQFVGSASMGEGVDTVAAAVRTTLGFSLEAFRSAPTVEKAFAYLRDLVERIGIFVILAGDLGSHHTEIPVEVFRGFAVADPIAPMVVINDRDAKTAWSFTLLHEVAHLWLGTTGVSGSRVEQVIEKFCNDVAGELLLPREELRDLRIQVDDDVEAALALLQLIAAPRRVSRAMVAYKLLRLGRISSVQWRAIDDKLQALWRREREVRRERPKASEGGPTYYVVRRHRLGTALLSFARRNLDAGALSPSKAARVLGVKPRSVYPLLSLVKSGREA
jgi:Zn-dependent peptidase ImmA (M78 family)/transcriptional regulator with XRE-family HTH domain